MNLQYRSNVCDAAPDPIHSAVHNDGITTSRVRHLHEEIAGGSLAATSSSSQSEQVQRLGLQMATTGYPARMGLVLRLKRACCIQKGIS